MKTIILFMPYGSVGGMERLALTFYDFYKNEGYKVIGVKIIGLENDIISFGKNEISLSKKDFHQYSKIGRLLFYIKIPWLLRKTVKNNTADFTISFGDMANCFSAMTKTHERKIASIHAVKSIEFQTGSYLNSFFKKSLRTRYQRFQKVVCISKAIKNDLSKKLNYPHDNLEVIYNPHPIDKIIGLSKQPMTERGERKIFKDYKVLLFIGRLSIQKSPWHLLHIFHLLNDKSYQLVFIGDGDAQVKKYLEQIIAKLGEQKNVHFLGRKNNPYPYLKQAHLLCLTSLYEGTPNVIAESIILKTPVITSHCTDGLLEMMSDGDEQKQDNLILTKAGIITPNLYKGKLEIPDKETIISEERTYVKALQYFEKYQAKFYRDLENNYENLTRKYRMSHVCRAYLSEK